jgi:hypothetical protein
VALEAKTSLPGCAFASAMSSFTDFTPRLGVTTSTFVLKPIWLIPEKSFRGSYGTLGCSTVLIARLGSE